MSMLAERKSKQKWSLNPRGKAWSEDSTKFGQKMLERMGWSKGKGLGPKEDGMVDHLKISYKNDSKGMGYKDRNDQWTDLDVKFNALLESFSGEKIDENEIKIASLEQKSQSSKVRVHYKKFTRGKDLSRCSEKDLACIFGKRSLKPLQNGETKVEEKEVVENGNFTYNSVSMVDYFKKKLPGYGKSNGYVAKKDSESEEEGYIGLGFTNGKKRKSDDVVINGTPKKVKMQEGLSNPAFDPLFGHVEVQKHVLNTIEEENDDDEVVLKRKKKKAKDEQNEEIENVEVKSDGTGKKKKKTFDENCEESQNSFVNGNFEVKRKKKTPIDNPSFDINSDTQGSFSSDTFEVKRKKKKEKILTPVDNPSFDITSDTHNSVSSDAFEVKRKKKEKTLTSVDNPSFDVNSDTHNSFSSDAFEVKRKKKEKTLTPVDNPSFDINSDTHNSVSNDAFEVKRKKKEKTLTPVDNPSFDINSDTQNNVSNDAFEVKRKKKKEKSLTPIDDPSLDITPSSFSNDSYEVRRRKKKKESDGVDNPNFVCQNGDASYERKKKKSAVDNPVFDSSNECQNSFVDPSFEVKRKKKKKKSEDENTTQEEPSFDLILNVTSTPSLAKAESSSKRRKSVRFSDKIEKRIIPNNEDVENRNELFDINSQVIAKSNDDLEGNIDEISKKIEGFQAEIENDINEAKAINFVGEVGDPDGENEKLPEGTKLKFKYANFGRSPSYLQKNTTKAKSSYKHLIKGDIILGFVNTNLHEIVGYGVKKIDK